MRPNKVQLQIASLPGATVSVLLSNIRNNLKLQPSLNKASGFVIMIGTNNFSDRRNSFPISHSINQFNELVTTLKPFKGQVHVIRPPPKKNDILNGKLTEYWTKVVEHYVSQQDII